MANTAARLGPLMLSIKEKKPLVTGSTSSFEIYEQN